MEAAQYRRATRGTPAAARGEIARTAAAGGEETMNIRLRVTASRSSLQRRRPASASSRSGASSSAPPPTSRRRKTPSYDGRFTFARLKYATDSPRGYYYCGLPAWAHGYPRAAAASAPSEPDADHERGQLSGAARRRTSIVLALDDPELFKYPVAYMTEAGYWDERRGGGGVPRVPAEGRLRDLRRLPRRFRSGGGWDNFEPTCGASCPSAQFVDLRRRRTRSSTRSSRSIRSTSSRRRTTAARAGLPRRLRGQRSEQAADGDHQLQHRHLAISGSSRTPASGRSTNRTRRTSSA